MTEFKGKTALITGASEGIGRATAQAFARNGANLILISRNRERLLSLSEELKPLDVAVQIETIDLRDHSSVEGFFAQKSTAFDYAVNNAGVEGQTGDFSEMSLEEFDRVFDVNVRALWLCMKAEISHFRRHNLPGKIVNIASILGFKAVPGSSLYVASKHAVLGFTKAAAIEQARFQIRVNCVSPGATDTPMIHRILGGRSVEAVGVKKGESLISPNDIAEGVVWLCSEKSKHLVGHNLVIDSGQAL